MHGTIHISATEGNHGDHKMAQIDDDVLGKVQTFIRKLKESGIAIESAYLFGSYATNRAGRWSDIDVAIVSPDFSDDRFDERLRLMKLSTEIDNRIEPVPFHSDAFNDTDPLVDEIKKSGISLLF
jgi:predicted nucleotidyltransferase